MVKRNDKKLISSIRNEREREETWKEFSGNAENPAALFVSAFNLEDIEVFELVLLRRRRLNLSGHMRRIPSRIRRKKRVALREWLGIRRE